MPDGTSVPDVYADQFIISAAVWGVNLSFLKAPPHPSPGQQPQAEAQAVIRMSLEHAKIMAIVIKKQLKQYEHDNGVEIVIPQMVYNAMGLSPTEDW
jgi:hypothetical protein